MSKNLYVEKRDFAEYAAKNCEKQTMQEGLSGIWGPYHAWCWFLSDVIWC